MTHFTKKDGLADDYVQRITMDADGVMWFATGMGVSKYTGAAAKPGQPLFITLPPLNEGC
jgi:ligand-binding sensor domain-containing protein